MRVCVIGNSHVAALVSGWTAAAPRDRFEFGFYAIPGGHEPKLIAVNGRLRPRDPDARLQTTIVAAESAGLDLTSFDAVVMSACGLFAARNENVVPDPAAHPLSSVCVADWIEPGEAQWPAGTQFVSAAVFDTVVNPTSDVMPR